MKWKMNLGLSVLLLIYILVGALVFSALEYQKFTPPDIRQMTFFQEFLANHSSMEAAELEEFARKVVTACREEEGVVGNTTEQDNGWTYDNSVFFTITVVSTIGFGHITPKTTGGKVFCIFFALIGIPMAVSLLASLGTHLRKPIDYLHSAKPWCARNSVRDKQIKSAVVLSVGTVFMLCAPALVFTFTEDWDYLTSLYYSTVTLTTVGFGDYVAGIDGNHNPWFRFVMSLWLAVGLAYVAMVISEASEFYSGWQRRVVSRTGEEEQEEPSTTKDVTMHQDPSHEQNGELKDWREENCRRLVQVLDQCRVVVWVFVAAVSVLDCTQKKENERWEI
ncbi:potassium channel subfamily K member 2-like [Babylonia areolata]|uniref:potassium channel subfamily K member 2-like n=1 Tax=Babylonia areolata TaxID=304850 RepID=UPI003FD02075